MVGHDGRPTRKFWVGAFKGPGGGRKPARGAEGIGPGPARRGTRLQTAFNAGVAEEQALESVMPGCCAVSGAGRSSWQSASSLLLGTA